MYGFLFQRNEASLIVRRLLIKKLLQPVMFICSEILERETFQKSDLGYHARMSGQNLYLLIIFILKSKYDLVSPKFKFQETN